jgi:imidazolonepropionase-like amidohydrolase
MRVPLQGARGSVGDQEDRSAIIRIRHHGPVAWRRFGLKGLFGRTGTSSLGSGAVFRGTVWAGGGAAPVEGVVVVDGAGRVDRIGPVGQVPVPGGLPVYGGPGHWVGPGLTDAHVHVAVSGVPALATGLVAVRDLGAPAAVARVVRTGHRRPAVGQPFVAVAAQIVTAPGGYPSVTWGRDGFAAFAADPAQARVVVQRLAVVADVIKIALEPGPAGWPVPEPATIRAVVDAAHSAGLPVVAHALRAGMVARAVDAGVDELAHTPTERLPPELVERIAAARIGVVSTLQTFFSEGSGTTAAANAADLVEAGVTLRYGTDLGNTGTRPGVDPRELDRLADAGLGRLGALRAATEAAAAAPGIRGRTGRLRAGEPAALVMLPGDPLREPGLWRTVVAVVADGRLLLPTATPEFARMDDVDKDRAR